MVKIGVLIYNSERWTHPNDKNNPILIILHKIEIFTNTFSIHKY